MNEQNDDIAKVQKVFPDAIPLKVVDTRWTVKDFGDFVERLSFTFAKTYKKFAPHEYAIFHRHSPDKADMKKAVEFIDRYGYTIHFYGGMAFQCVNYKGMRYWYAFMTDDHTAPDILNRTSNENTQGIPPNQLHHLQTELER
ncbi:MAG: hypothetical protein KIG14_02680 [Candidatus Sacchiramonaceae bacterium]|nr:hypothetical protein [Candidatus Saccharimonadaceae bacterium]